MTEREFIEEILRELAPYAADRYSNRGEMDIATKRDDNDLVTAVDLAVQRKIIDRIAQCFPGDAVVAEEEDMDGTPPCGSARCWLIDPIDGTQNFVRSLFPAFGISIAFAQSGQVVAGGIALPVVDSLFMAEQGAGAYRNGDRLQVSAVTEAGLARIEVDFGGLPFRHETVVRGQTLIERAGQVRCHAAATIGLVATATGDHDAYMHVHLNPYDFAAGIILVEESGGKCTDFRGEPLHLFEGRTSILASNGAVHDEVLSLIGPG